MKRFLISSLVLFSCLSLVGCSTNTSNGSSIISTKSFENVSDYKDSLGKVDTTGLKDYEDDYRRLWHHRTFEIYDYYFDEVKSIFDKYGAPYEEISEDIAYRDGYSDKTGDSYTYLYLEKNRVKEDSENGFYVVNYRVDTSNNVVSCVVFLDMKFDEFNPEEFKFEDTIMYDLSKLFFGDEIDGTYINGAMNQIIKNGERDSFSERFDKDIFSLNYDEHGIWMTINIFPDNNDYSEKWGE